MKNKRLILEMALYMNKELFDCKRISYRTFKYVSNDILRRINSI